VIEVGTRTELTSSWSSSMRAVKRSTSQRSVPSLAPAIEQFVQGEVGVLLTPAALLGLSYCHEKLVDVIGCALASPAISQSASQPQIFSSDTARSRVLPRHVKDALTSLGMDPLWMAASETLQLDKNVQKSSGKTVRSNKRRKEWTKDQEEEQNRLLELSKEKLLSRP
jgi:hypothetical protein